MKEVTKKPSAARSHPYARPPAPASSYLASPQPEQRFAAFTLGAIPPLAATNAGPAPFHLLNKPPLFTTQYLSHSTNNIGVQSLYSTIATSSPAENQRQPIMNTACTFRGCPIVAHAQRCSQAVTKHHHLHDGSIPLKYNGTLAYVRHVQGRWSMAACNENRPMEISTTEQSSNNAGVPNTQMLSPPSISRTPMPNQTPTMAPFQSPLSETHPYPMSCQLSGNLGYSAGLQHGTVQGVGVPQMSRQPTVPTQSPQDAALIGTGAHKTRPMQAQVYRQPINVHQMMSQPQHSRYTPQQQGARQHFFSPPSPLISQAYQLPQPYLSGADIMASTQKINNEAGAALYGQKRVQNVQAPQQFTFILEQFTLAPPSQQPATAQHLTTPVPQQQPTMLAAPAFFSNPRTAAAPAITPIPAPAPLSSTTPSVRPKASVPECKPHPTKIAMKEDPRFTTAKPTSPLDLTTANPRITPIPIPVPATTQVKAREQVQQQLQPAEQQGKQARVERPQYNSTPSAEVERQPPPATPTPVAEPAVVTQVTPVRVPVQIVEDIHKCRVREWWSTNPYGDQSQLYLPGSGVPPGVKPCGMSDCVYCARVEG